MNKPTDDVSAAFRRVALQRARELVAALVIGDDVRAGAAWGEAGLALVDVGLVTSTSAGDAIRVTFRRLDSGAGRSSRSLSIVRRPQIMPARRVRKPQDARGGRGKGLGRLSGSERK